MFPRILTTRRFRKATWALAATVTCAGPAFAQPPAAEPNPIPEILPEGALPAVPPPMELPGGLPVATSPAASWAASATR